ncbi:MAG: hypothetical protein VSS75_023880 [Candidatus Parabeggiatoa sp.]|nr:hypothetical protein [Candidatus Parabeggiatoa sp.]
MNWFSYCSLEHSVIRCAACQFNIPVEMVSLDHHPRWCPSCHAECFLFVLDDRYLQIIIEKAPLDVQKAIRWAQKNLDEIEFVNLIASLEDIFQTVKLSGVSINLKY